MKLIFLGTRGGIKARSPKHFWQSSLLISFRRTRIRIDYGSDWQVQKVPSNIKGILITHAHPDHVGGISPTMSIPLYTTQETWSIFKKPLLTAHVIRPYEPFLIGSLLIEVIPVYHSLRAPAVGYKIRGGNHTLVYIPDAVGLIDPHKVLNDIDPFIGDGALVKRTLLKRTKQGVPVGHWPIREQLALSARYNVPRALFTHCGTELVTGDEVEHEKLINQMGKELGLKAGIAFDGMQLTIKT